MSSIITSILTGTTNSYATSAAQFNALGTDFFSQGVVGAITNTSGVSPSTGAFAVNQDSSPDMGVTITAGNAWISATPSGQTSQLLRASMASNYSSYTISANSSGSTKYDWIYLKVDPTNSNTPDSTGDNATSVYTSRSSSSSTDNGSPPTYGILLAVVTVANGASSITNANITDMRAQAYSSSSGDNGVALQTIRSETQFDFVASGCVWTGDSYGSTLNASMTAGVVYIGGKRITVSAVTARTYTASKDTYVDVDNTGALHYTAVSNNAASPALSTGYLRLAIVVTGSSSIAASTSINQGQETMVLPIASSVPYAVTDSLGNLICPRDPNRKILGYRQVISSQGSITTEVDLTGLTMSVNVPSNRKIKLCAKLVFSTSVANIVNVTFKESTTALDSMYLLTNTAGNVSSQSSITITPSSGVHTYKLTAQTTANASTLAATSNVVSSFWVELV